MNKKEYRDKKHKRLRQVKLAPEIAGEHTLVASPVLAAAFVKEHGHRLMTLLDRVSSCVAEELAELLTYEKQISDRRQSKFLSLFAALNSLFGRNQPKPELKYTVQNAYACADGFIEDIGTTELACRKGCNWCCTFKVALSIPEAFYIAEYLKDSLPAEDFVELKKKISQTAQQVAGMSDKERKISRIFCPLLVNESCSVYNARPITCRGYNSSDEAACKRNHFSRYDTNVPYKLRIKEYTYTVFYGINDGAKLSGLQSNSVELIGALNFIFQHPDAEKRWLSGEEVFPTEIVMLESYNP